MVNSRILVYDVEKRIGGFGMYERHEQLFELEDNCVLWKYMSFSKFVNMLSGKIYFNRLDNFEDVFEGTFPHYNAMHRDEIYGEDIIPKNIFDMMEKAMKNWLYVSCFHKNEYETAFMWKQYADNDGIAIKTTFERLKMAFSNTKEAIYISNVQYIDYDKEFMPEGNGMYLAVHKRKSFEPEREVRCINVGMPKSKPNPSNPRELIADINEKTPVGRFIDIDMEELIEEIYISPYAASYIKENVELIASKFNISAKIIQSKLFTLN